MIKVNSLSGGRTSSYLAVHFPADFEVFALVCIDDHKSRPRDQAITKYANGKLEKYTARYGEFIASAEDDRTLAVMMDLEQYLGRNIIWVRGASFDNVIDLPLVRGENPTRLPCHAFRYCTDQMKVYPIFEWWFNCIGEKVVMRLGFRFDEFDRMERFLNGGRPGQYRIPVSTSTKGRHLQRHEAFDWRFCSFPLVKHGITGPAVNQYWQSNGYLPGDLFREGRKMEFPAVSNCVGCFHKKIETLAAMWSMHPEKMDWFSNQEKKGMGTWLACGMPYETIGRSRGWSEEMIKGKGASCDSGGCTD